MWTRGEETFIGLNMLEINNKTKQKINLKKIQALGAEFLRIYKKSASEVSLALVGPATIRRLNREYRGIDKATDVLSFSAVAENDLERNPKYLGEIIINLAETKKISKYQKMFEELGGEVGGEAGREVGGEAGREVGGEAEREVGRGSEKVGRGSEKVGGKNRGSRSGLSPRKRTAAENYLFYFLLIHGLLHLVGYDDQTEKSRREMLKRGRDFLALNYS